MTQSEIKDFRDPIGPGRANDRLPRTIWCGRPECQRGKAESTIWRGQYLTETRHSRRSLRERSTGAHKFTLVRLNYRFRFFGLTSLRYRSYCADNDTHFSNR